MVRKCLEVFLIFCFSSVSQIDYFSSWMTAQRLFALYITGHDICPRNGGKQKTGYVHPYVHKVSHLLQTSTERLKEAEANIAARPDPPQYEELRNVMLQFVRSMASQGRTEEMITRVRNLFGGDGEDNVDDGSESTVSNSKPNEDEINAILIPCTSWLESWSNFVHKQLKRFWYWDISLALLHPAVQVKY